jgi:hypothetical protein
MLCPICAGEFQLRVESCPTCECELVPSTLNQKAKAEFAAARSEPVKFVALCRPHIYPVAMLIKQMLEQHEVIVLIQGGNSLSVMPHLAFGGELRVLVDSRQIDYARSLYKAYFEVEDGTDFTTE